MLDRQLEEYMGPDAMKAGVPMDSQTLCRLPPFGALRSLKKGGQGVCDPVYPLQAPLLLQAEAKLRMEAMLDLELEAYFKAWLSHGG